MGALDLVQFHHIPSLLILTNTQCFSKVVTHLPAISILWVQVMYWKILVTPNRPEHPWRFHVWGGGLGSLPAKLRVASSNLPKGGIAVQELPSDSSFTYLWYLSSLEDMVKIVVTIEIQQERDRKRSAWLFSKIANFYCTECCRTKKWGRILPEVQWCHQM